MTTTWKRKGSHQSIKFSRGRRLHGLAGLIGETLTSVIAAAGDPCRCRPLRRPLPLPAAAPATAAAAATAAAPATAAEALPVVGELWPKLAPAQRVLRVRVAPFLAHDPERRIVPRLIARADARNPTGLCPEPRQGPGPLDPIFAM